MLPEWQALAALDDAALPLFQTALLIASDEYPQLDAAALDARMQGHADALRPTLSDALDWPARLAAINAYLFDEVGYAGNHEDYYDPTNSYLNDVLTRRLGNPISLALLQIEVARRLGIALEGVSFPGHFLVRLALDDGLLVIDPFNRGRPLEIEELRRRARPHLGGEVPDDAALAELLQPATSRAMLLRMLRNLHGAYATRGDWERAARCADRMLYLVPEHADALRDRGLAYLHMGHRRGARQDLARYLDLAPDAEDAGVLRDRLIEASCGPALTN